MIYKVLRISLTACLFILAKLSSAQTDPQIIASAASPNGLIKIDFSLHPDAGLKYKVSDQNSEITGWSALGLVTSKTISTEPFTSIKADFTSSVTFITSETYDVSDRYEMITGKQRENHYAAKALRIKLEDVETRQKLNVEAHLADDGFALRYVLPEKSPLYYRIDKDIMEFNLGSNPQQAGTHWGQAYDFANHWKPAYETPFYNGLPIGTDTPEKDGTGWGFPSLFEDKDGRWMMLSETGLTADYHGSHLSPKASGGIYRLAPPLSTAAEGIGHPISVSTLPLEMPWRFMVISDDLGDILESNRVFDLAPPQKYKDTKWIKPGLASWSWWSDHASSRSFEAMTPFIDLAAEMGWPYSLIDANWNLINDTSLKDLIAYGRKKKVGLLFWYNSGGPHNFVTEEPRNKMHERRIRRAEFARLQKAGAKGVKVDFFHSDNQDRIAQYIGILQDAADFNLLVNFHGSTIPRGWQRTYPHLMTMESVRGGEVYTFPSEPDYGVLATYQNTILPFTRNVIGSMDYTPTGFSNQTVRHLTSYAHEAALAVIFESGLQHLADSVESYRAMSQDYKDYLKDIPTAWDETVFLSGYPGKDVILARRKGKAWYIAGINGEGSPKTVDINISKLKGLKRSGILLYDADDPFQFKSRKLSHDGQNLRVEMGPYGGFVFNPN